MSWSFGSALAKEFQKTHEEYPDDLLAELNAASLCQASQQETETAVPENALVRPTGPVEILPDYRLAPA